MNLSSSQAFNSSRFLNRSRGVKKRSQTSPTWFSTCPFSQPDAGVQPTGSQGERPVVGVEHHLLRLPRIGPHEQHAAVTEPDMGSLHHHRGAAQQDDLVAPVELVGFAWRKTQRDISGCGRLPAFLAPPSCVSTNRIIAAGITEAAKLFEQPDQRQPFPRRLALIPCQQPVKLGTPGTHLRERLRLALIPELRR